MLFLGAGIWELIRFALLFLSFVLAPAAFPNAHLNLLWVAAPALLIAALFFVAAYFPRRNPYYVPLLRIGTGITVLSDVAVLVTGSYDWTAVTPGTGAVSGRLLAIIALAVLVLDLAALALTLYARTDSANDGSGRAGPTDDLPEYDPTDVDES